MRWATRASIHVDGAACAWVIRRDIDPDAEFVILNGPAADQSLREMGFGHLATGDLPADATPFAMDGAELSRHTGPDGTDCCFETILRRYEVVDPTLWRIAEVVHEAVLWDERYNAPEARGLDALVYGLSLVGNDKQVLAITKPLFDGLYKRFYLQSLLGQNRDWPAVGPISTD